MIEMENNKIKAKTVGNYVLVHGIDLSTDTWNKLAKSNDYPPGGYLGVKYGTVLFLLLRRITMAFLLRHSRTCIKVIFPGILIRSTL